MKQLTVYDVHIITTSGIIAYFTGDLVVSTTFTFPGSAISSISDESINTSTTQFCMVTEFVRWFILLSAYTIEFYYHIAIQCFPKVTSQYRASVLK